MKILPAILAFSSFIFAASAQTGDISGKVTNEMALGIKSVKVMLVDSLGVTSGKGRMTDADGNYTISYLAPGKYNLQYLSKGYSSQTIAGIVVNVEKSTFVNVQLKRETKRKVK
jgi:hypothetical protein